MGIVHCHVWLLEGNVSSCFGVGCEWSRSGVDCWICETNGQLYTYTWYCIPYHHTPILSHPKDIHSNSYIMLYNNGSWKFVHELKLLLHNQGCIIIRYYTYILYIYIIHIIIHMCNNMHRSSKLLEHIYTQTKYSFPGCHISPSSWPVAISATWVTVPWVHSGNHRVRYATVARCRSGTGGLMVGRDPGCRSHIGCGFWLSTSRCIYDNHIYI